MRAYPALWWQQTKKYREKEMPSEHFFQPTTMHQTKR
jgi:hypothetical protein